MSRCALFGAHLVDPELDEPVEATLLVENGHIVDRLRPDAEPGGDWPRADLFGRLVAPGFIDLHFHGELFAAPCDAFAGALARAGDEMLAHGTTAFLATTVSWDHEATLERVGELTRLIGSGNAPGAACLGLHLEGPWLSAEAPGAMAAGCLRPFEPRRDRDVLDRAGELLRMVTLAPEIEGAAALLDELARRDVVASLGHSRAGRDQIDAGIARGLRHVTHLFNAMGPFHHRAPGVAGHVLAEDRLSCDLICDGHHVHPDAVRIAARTLSERLLLISDRVDLPGWSDDAASPGAPARLADGTIAGSRLGQHQAVRNAMAFGGLPLTRAVAAASLRPARLLGIEHTHGTLRRGARADLAILDDEGRLLETWMGGRPVWVRGAAAA